MDAAVDFVLSKIALSVGTREAGPQVPVRYEIPKEVIAEAIVNAVAHRDYTSTGSVQAMLFTDRLEIWNPGLLPPSLTLERLRQAHGSVPANPLLAESMYLAGYIERMGTGTQDMIRRCAEAGLPEPEFTVSDGFRTIIRRPPFPGLKLYSGSQPESLRREPGEEPGEPGEEPGEPGEEPGEPGEEIRGTGEEPGEPREEPREPREEPREETRNKILALIAADPTITMRELAEHIGITPKGIEWQIRRLREAGRLRRVGPTKGGRWEITGGDAP